MLMQPIIPVIEPVIVRRRRAAMDPFSGFFRHSGHSYLPLQLAQQARGAFGFGALHDMSRMMEELADFPRASSQFLHGGHSDELQPDDRAFLHPNAADSSGSGVESGAEAGEKGTANDHAGGVFSQSYSYSSVRRGDQPAVEQTVRKVVTADGQERTVTRKRLGEQELVVRQSAADSEVYRALEGVSGAEAAHVGDKEDAMDMDKAMDRFEQDFEDARSGRATARQQLLESQAQRHQEAQQEAAQQDETQRAAPRPSTPHPAKTAEPEAASGFSFGNPVQPPAAAAVVVDPKQVALVKEVMPELDDGEAAALLQKHSGDVRAVLREQLSQ